MKSIDVAQSCAGRTAGIILRSALLAEGLQPPDIRRLLSSGVVRRIDVGVYALAESLTFFQDVYRCRVLGYLQTRREGSPGVLTGLSALVLRGMPVWARIGDVCVGRDHAHGPKAGRVKNLGHIPSSQTAAATYGPVGPYEAATTARSVCDAARCDPLVNAVAAGDAALRNGLTTSDAIADALASMRGMKNIAQARFAATLLDGAAESPGESASRWSLHRLGVPAPQLQREVYDDSGLVGRVDFLWEEFGIVGEYDGKFKYGRSNPSERPPEDVLFEEKRREDRLRAAGYIVVRWTTEDLLHPDRFRRLIAGAFQQAARLRKTRLAV